MSTHQYEKGPEEKGPDEIIHELGGCGRFQLRVTVIIHMMSVVVVWSMYAMVFVTAPAVWRCRDDSRLSTNINNTGKTFGQVCNNQNGSLCSKFEFETSDINTVATEWSLVCDMAWIPALINSVQIGCLIVGHLCAGHLADYRGRKCPIYFSLAILIICNLLSYFSVNWLMYAISKALTGIACGLYMTTPDAYMSEFALARWRPWVIGFPAWAIESSMLALVLWLLKDWRNTHLVITLVGIPFLATWWLVPESFRWYYAHDRIGDAEKVITKIATVNRRPNPDMTYMKRLAEMGQQKKDRNYSILDLFKTKLLVKVSLLLMANWFALGVIGYGVMFGIQRLSGDIYLNMFLFAMVTIPAKVVTVWLTNRIGRRYTAMLLFSITAVSSLVVGFVQYIDTEQKASITNGFAIVANIGIGTLWSIIGTMTVEIYPTVVRNIGYGLCSTLCRIGAALAPQLVFLEMYVPGILYFCCGGLSVLCVCAIFYLPETRDSNLSDKL